MKKRKFFLKRSLKNQIISLSFLILAVILLIVGAFQYFLMRDFLYQNQADSIEGQLRSLPPMMTRIMDDEEESLDDLDNRRPILFDRSLSYIDVDGNYTDLANDTGITSPVLDEAELEELANANTGETAYLIAEDEEGNEQLVVAVSDRTEDGGYIQAGTETEPIEDVILAQLRVFIILAIIALIIGVILYIQTIRKALHPLHEVVEVVERTGAENLSERLHMEQSQEEIERLTAAFNRMLGRIEGAFESEREAKEQMRRFIADASHELRTPLTSIHGFLEVLLRGAAEKPEQLYPALKSMLGESERIKKLVEDLLLLAQLDQSPDLELKQISLRTIIEDMEPHLYMLAGERNVIFSMNGQAAGAFDTDKIKQVLLNLFYNAVQHTDPEKGKIEVRLTDDGTNAVLSVKDNGPGIAAEHLPLIFDRFYRSDTSRARKRGGAGLGLSISMSIVKAHHGIISAESEPGKGTAFIVKLPL